VVYCTLTEVFLNLTEVFLTLTEVFLTLTEVFPCFFLSCKANARVKLAKTGHGPYSSTLVCIYVVRLLFVSFCVSFVCKFLLPPGDNPFAINKYIISSYKLTPRPFYPQKVSRYLLTRRMGSPRAGMNDSGKKKSFISAGIRTANRPACRAFTVRLRKVFRLFNPLNGE
jgi:hypothetical protein